MFDLRRLEAFVAFADARSFTKAARVLHVSQPAVHMQVTKLEEELGVALYRRDGRLLALTDAGERVAAFGRDVARGARRLEADLHGDDHAHDAAEPVVLAAGEGAFLYLLGPAIRAYVGPRRAPLKLLTRDAEGALAAVREGVAHVGVATLPRDGAPSPGSTRGLSVTPLCDVPQCVALPKNHPLAARRRLRPSDLSWLPLVVPPQGRPHRAMIHAVLEAAQVRWHVAVEAMGWEVTLQFVRLGVGVAVVNAYCRVPAGVVTRPISGFPPVAFAVVTRQRMGLDPRVERLAVSLRAHADAWRPP